ncbi:MAG: hypothetical protein GY842_22440 [bacterium]|nr:hypothetical protein [bacterium]
MRKGQPHRPGTVSLSLLLALGLLLPMVMGGCPEFRNESVAAIETATRGVLNAGLDLLFDQYRTDEAK